MNSLELYPDCIVDTAYGDNRKIISIILKDLYVSVEKAISTIPILLANYVGRRRPIYDFGDEVSYDVSYRRIEITQIKGDQNNENKDVEKNIIHEFIFNESFIKCYNMCITEKDKLQLYIENELQQMQFVITGNNVVNLTKHQGTEFNIDLPNYMTFKHVCEIIQHIFKFKNISIHTGGPYVKNTKLFLIIEPTVTEDIAARIKHAFAYNRQELILTSDYAKCTSKIVLKARFSELLNKIINVHVPIQDIAYKQMDNMVLLRWHTDIMINNYNFKRLDVLNYESEPEPYLNKSYYPDLYWDGCDTDREPDMAYSPSDDLYGGSYELYEESDNL